MIDQKKFDMNQEQQEIEASGKKDQPIQWQYLTEYRKGEKQLHRLNFLCFVDLGIKEILSGRKNTEVYQL